MYVLKGYTTKCTIGYIKDDDIVPGVAVITNNISLFKYLPISSIFLFILNKLKYFLIVCNACFGECLPCGIHQVM